MNDKLDLEVTIKPALTVERIREELADMVGLQLNAETKDEIVRRLDAIGLFDFSVEAKPQHDSDCSTNNRGVPELLGPCDCSLSKAKPTCTDERPCVNCFSGQGECLADQGVLSKIISAELVKAQSGDLVLFRVDAGTVTADDVEPLSKYLHAKLPAGVICMVVVGDVEITSMSEEQLKQVGLVRVGSKEPDDLTQFLEQTDFDAAEKVASATVDSQPTLPPGEDDCEGCKI